MWWNLPGLPGLVKDAAGTAGTLQCFCDESFEAYEDFAIRVGPAMWTVFAGGAFKGSAGSCFVVGDLPAMALHEIRIAFEDAFTLIFRNGFRGKEFFDDMPFGQMVKAGMEVGGEQRDVSGCEGSTSCRIPAQGWPERNPEVAPAARTKPATGNAEAAGG